MKTALITGASGGIGSALAVAFAQQGYAVVLNYNNSEEKARRLADVITESYRVPALAVKCDVSDYTQVCNMFSVIEENFGGADVLLNNAGISEQSLFTDITAEQWRRMMGINLDSVFHCCKSALPYMISKKSGVIINISSMWGQTGASCEVHYSTAKAGIIGLTKALAKEVGPSGVRVNAIAPGVVMTDMMSSFSEEDVCQLKDETPLQKLGTPKNIADAAVFLASQKAEFITGQILGVNGGFVI
ncbi:MAG: SDR family oxidoreductase [Ruminococcus sp.]|nr:SDR family oxidoreductase [Ruminococcus sp.]